MTRLVQTEQRRREILDAALDCFSRLGFAAATMEDIRARSGASTGSIYHHFAGKAELAAALYLSGLFDYQEGMLVELGRHRVAERGVRSIVEHHLDWVKTHPALARFLLYMRQAEAVAATAAEVRAQRQEFFRRALAWLAPHIQHGDILDLPAPVLVSLIIGPCQEYGRYWLGRSESAELGPARRALSDAAWASVRNPHHREKA